MPGINQQISDALTITIPRLEREKKELYDALKEARGMIDVSLIKTSKKATRQWELLALRIDKAFSNVKPPREGT